MHPAKWVLSNAALPVSASVGSALFRGCPGSAGHRSEVAVTWDQEKLMAPGCESWLALCPP